MDINETINLLKCSEIDKNILREIALSKNMKLCENLSFYSKKYNMIKSLDDYKYIQTNSEDYIYYNCRQPSIFIDNEKKIIFNSKWWFNNGNQPNEFINHMRHVLNYLQNINLDNFIDISHNLISIQSWFSAYGHFMDESFNLCDFYLKYKNKKNNNINLNIFQDYPKDNLNYNEIKNKLFENNHINPQLYLPNTPLLRFKNLILIKHTIFCQTFHSFPINIRQKIIESIMPANSIIEKNINCFITRNIATHLPRNLSNQKEIECFIKSLDNFSVINPENISFDAFINILQNQKLVIITWGSALTNLIYLKPNTNVIILQSKSYEHENIVLFKQVVKHLNIGIIKHTDNIIDTLLIMNLINKFKNN
jgi:hypothetical protein